jgi:hypothetical protein
MGGWIVIPMAEALSFAESHRQKLTKCSMASMYLSYLLWYRIVDVFKMPQILNRLDTVLKWTI